MSDMTLCALPMPAAEAQFRPSFAKGLIWGGALSVLLWTGLGYLAIRLL